MPKLEPVTAARQPVTGDSKTSVTQQREILTWAISELERIEKAKKHVEVSQTPNLPLQNRLVKLIGKKPLFNCSLGGVSSTVLWDSGSMISMVNTDWVEENFPGAELRPMSDFVEEGDDQYEFKAANGTDVPMVGCISLEFKMGNAVFSVPFLVTSSTLQHPIIGFNVMIHLIMLGEQTREELIDSLVASYQGKAADKIECMVSLVEKTAAKDDFLGDLRAVKSCVVPAKSTIRIRCKVRGEVKGLDLSFISSAPVTGEWDEELEVTEASGELKRGRTPFVNIEITNTSAKEKHISKDMIVGEISSVSAVFPLKYFQSEAGLADVCAVEEAVPVTSGEKWQPKAKLDHRGEEDRVEIEELLWEEYDVFAKIDTDTREIPDFHMDTNLTDK